MKPGIGSESRFLSTAGAFDAPVRGGVLSEYCFNVCYKVWYGKIRMVWLPEGKKNLKICLFVLTECTHKRDRHTGRQTDGHRMTAKAALA